MNKLLRRQLWLYAFLAGLAAVLLVLIFRPARLVVVVYNNSNQPFHQTTLSVGTQHKEAASLDIRESMAFVFSRNSAPVDVGLFVDADPPLQWSAPSLAGPSVARITLRVDAFGGVTATLEETIARRIGRFFN